MVSGENIEVVYLNQYSTAVGLVLSSSDNKNQTNSVYDIFCIPAGLLRFRAPFVTQPENIRSIIRVDSAKSFHYESTEAMKKKRNNLPWSLCLARSF